MKLNNPLTVFDLETTGLSVEDDRIVQFAWKRYETDLTVNKKGVILVYPNRRISPEATAIHGIGDLEVAEAKQFKQHIAEGLLDIFDDADVAGYNINRFDMPLLIEEILRSGYDLPFRKDMVLYDAMQIFFRDAPRNLVGAFKHYVGGVIDEEKLHDAGYDTFLTDEVIKAQLPDDKTPEEEMLTVQKDGQRPYRFSQKFYIKDDIVYLGFGKHKDKRAKDNLDYLEWMCTANFTNNDQNIAADILNENKSDGGIF